MRRKNEVSLGEAINQMVDEFKLRAKLDESRVKDNWPVLMGKTIAKYTESVTMKEGKLYVKINSAPLKQELSYSRDKIKEIFNAELGNETIREVFIF